MSDKVLIIGNGGEKVSPLHIAALKEKYGEDVILLTPEEANEQNLKMEDFVNIPEMKITAPAITDSIVNPPISGKEKRRERRKKERIANKKAKK